MIHSITISKTKSNRLIYKLTALFSVYRYVYIAIFYVAHCRFGAFNLLASKTTQ